MSVTVQDLRARLDEAQALVEKCIAVARAADTRTAEWFAEFALARSERDAAREALREAVIAALDRDECHEARIAILAAAGMWPDDRLADDLRAAIETGMYCGDDIYTYAAAACQACARNDVATLDRMRLADVADWPDISISD